MNFHSRNIVIFIWIGLCFPIFVFGSNFNESEYTIHKSDNIYFFYAITLSGNNNDISKSTHKFEKLVRKSKTLYAIDTISWIENVYSYVQRKQLKKYTPYISFDNTMQNGIYDCLTGTILYSLILTELGISHEILEFSNHVLIVGNVNGKDFLLEATDPFNGFITEKTEIDERKKQVLHAFLNTDMVSLQKIETPINISLKELVGLHYFNQALVAYTENDFNRAMYLIQVAASYYPSTRIGNMKLLLSLN